MTRLSMPCPNSKARNLGRALCLATVLALPKPAAARDERPPEVESPSEVKPGKTALVAAPDDGLQYFLRVPRGYDGRDGARLIVFLHGSNMNGLSYLRSFEDQRWCEDDILCCPNGEKGDDPFGRNNFSFNSGPMVAEVTKAVQGAFKTTVTYVGGHSQGAFLTYNVILNFPDLYRGAFPMAGDCWMQNEPNLWADRPEMLAKQRDIAIAVIHGKADPVVKFSQGKHAYDCFRAMGWTKLRLFSPDRLNHMFMRAPIDDALEWLDAMNARNARKSSDLAGDWADDGEWGWAWHAAAATTSPDRIRDAAEAAADQALPAIREALRGKPAAWVPKWIEFWRIHGETQAAKPIIDDYLSHRAAQRDEALRLFREAQSRFRAKNPDAAYETLEQLRDKAPNSYHAVLACQWLADRDE